MLPLRGMSCFGAINFNRSDLSLWNASPSLSTELFVNSWLQSFLAGSLRNSHAGLSLVSTAALSFFFDDEWETATFQFLIIMRLFLFRLVWMTSFDPRTNLVWTNSSYRTAPSQQKIVDYNPELLLMEKSLHCWLLSIWNFSALNEFTLILLKTWL